MTNTQQDSEIL